jgi:hypothetical protein
MFDAKAALPTFKKCFDIPPDAIGICYLLTVPLFSFYIGDEDDITQEGIVIGTMI